MLRCAKDYVLSWFFSCPVSRLSQALLRSQVSLFYTMTLPMAFSNVYLPLLGALVVFSPRRGT